MSNKHWIQKAIKRPGALREKLDTPEGKNIPESKIKKAEHSNNPMTRKQANLAATLKGFKK